MIPTIIYGGDLASRAAEVSAVFPPGEYIYRKVTAETASILIDQIHTLVKDLSITAERPRLIWIEEADRMTVGAQNSLLKILEEPPKNTEFVLTAGSAYALLPTIRSRCTLVSLKKSDQAEGEGAELAIIKSALSQSPGDRVVTADSVGRKRDLLVIWIDALIRDLARKMNRETTPQALSILSQIASLVTSAESDLKANVSPPLVMQNLFLSLPRTRRP